MHPRCTPPCSQNFLFPSVYQKIGHMVVFYSEPYQYIKIDIAKEHLCGYYNQRRACINAPISVDPRTGHQVCSQCARVLARSGLRICDICDRQFIDTDKHQDPKYDVNCPRCVKEYDL